MVQPIDYTMDVLSPIEGYMQGLKFGEGIQTGRLNRELLQSQEGREQEKFAIAKQDRERSIASAQAAQQNAAAAKAALVDYVNKLEAGTATSADLRAAIVKFPKMAETLQAVSNSVSTERLNNEMKFAKQLAYTLTTDPEQAKLLLQEKADAAEASGDQKTAAIAKAQMLQIDQNFNAVLMQALAPLVTTMKPDEFDAFFTKTLKRGGDKLTLKSSEIIGGIASVQIMEDGKTRIVDTRTNTTVTGAAATALLNEAKELNEKPLSGIGKLVYDLANGAITQDQFDKEVAAQAKSGVNVTNVIGAADETLAKVLSTNLANQLTDAVDQGFAGSRRLATLGTLENLLIGSDTGLSAKTKQVLGTFGIATEGIGQIQAAESLISSLIPTAKTPGSGPMTDADALMFKNTFPSLLNSPEGNALILQTLEDVSNYEVAAALISGKVIDWAMTDPKQRADLVSQGLILSPKDGRKAILELPKVSFTIPTTIPSSTVSDVITKEEFMRDPNLSDLSDAGKEKVWEEYKKIMGMK
jgi:hypothetical protein